jgi:hypothetical protein
MFAFSFQPALYTYIPYAGNQLVGDQPPKLFYLLFLCFLVFAMKKGMKNTQTAKIVGGNLYNTELEFVNV